MTRKFFIITALLILSSCVETVAVATFGTGYLISRDKSVESTVQDSLILTKASKALFKNNDNKKFSNITVSVYEGRVLLTGYSKNRDNVQDAIKLIWEIKNVQEVINEVSVDAKDRKKRHILDLYLLTNIKSQIIWDKQLKAKDVNVSIYNGNIFILGKAEDEDKVKAVAEISSAVKGVKKVTSHVKS